MSTRRLPGYFEGLPAAILAHVKNNAVTSEVQAELDEIAPLLNTISKQNIFTVPAGYFEKADFVSAIQSTKKQGKLVNMRFARRWTQYAAAAVMAGVLVTGAFMFTDTKGTAEYEKYSNIDVSSELNKVSEDELVNYLDSDEHYASVPDIALAEAGGAEETLDDAEPVQVLSDDELSQYLKDNAEPSAATTQN
jgi:oligoribonuclease (3'-5' exoribonuclease)